jgi:hypothetical protein
MNSVSKQCNHILTIETSGIRYRELLKADSKRYKEYQEKERERKKLAWKKRSEEKKESDRVKARERQKRFAFSIHNAGINELDIY